MEECIQKLCLAGTGTEVRAASRMHFYDSRIWINVLKEHYNAFFQAVWLSILISSQGI